MHDIALVLFILAAASTTALTAQSKRHSWPLWLVLGAFFPLIAFLVIVLLPGRSQTPPI